MIKITRGRLPATLKAFNVKSFLADDGVTKMTTAERELARAIVFFTAPANYLNEVKLTKQKFSFVVYKDAECQSARKTSQ